METPENVDPASTLGGPENFQEFLGFVWKTWSEGGWLMIPLAALALLIYFEAMAIILRMNRSKVKKTPRDVWADWLRKPAEGKGHIGEVIRFVVGREGAGSPQSLLRLEAVKAKIIPDVNNRIVVLSVLVTVAPLMGLLGTVIGMLTTFRGLATSAGQAVDLVAEGIRVALITTQTGLMIAIPGYIFISLVIRSRNNYMTFLTELETVLVQQSHQKKSS